MAKAAVPMKSPFRERDRVFWLANKNKKKKDNFFKKKKKTPVSY
jgi:hypothetical protein